MKVEDNLRWWIDPEGTAHVQDDPLPPVGPKMACCGKWADVDWHEAPGGIELCERLCPALMEEEAQP